MVLPGTSLDRFHVMQKMNKPIDEVRAAEMKQLKADGYEPVLKHSRWRLLKRRENLTEKQPVNPPNCSSTTCSRFAAICCARTFSSSGSMSAQAGRPASSTRGVRERCVPNSNR